MNNYFDVEAKQLLERKLLDLSRKNHAEWAMYIFKISKHNSDGTLLLPIPSVKKLKKLLDYVQETIIMTDGPNAKEEVKKIFKALKTVKPAKAEVDPVVKELVDTFIQYSYNLKGFEPIVTISRAKQRIEEALKKYTADQIKDIFDFYLCSDLSEKPGCNINAALSDFIINKWEEKR